MQTVEQLAKIAAERKGISLETATNEITELLKDKSIYKQKLALASYLEDSTHPNHTVETEYNPILHHKE
jgi:hypothetical protein